jgi:hypothetical protein
MLIRLNNHHHDNHNNNNNNHNYTHKIPSHHIFFRTTSVRHFLVGKGDWDTAQTTGFQAGGIAPNMTATWSMYGGKDPIQPTQNLLALDVLFPPRNESTIKHHHDNDDNNDTFNHHHHNHPLGGVLDTSPMTLARADASFDGLHFCLPGPMDYWSQMLYYRMHSNYMREMQQQ